MEGPGEAVPSARRQGVGRRGCAVRAASDEVMRRLPCLRILCIGVLGFLNLSALPACESSAPVAVASDDLQMSTEPLRPVQRTDWLVNIGACALAEGDDSISTRMLYPRFGLPAVVEPGGVLRALVRLPTGLTPPPGVQRARARQGWGARLLGHAVVTPGAEFRYDLIVSNVRPVDGRSTVYRADIPLPAYTAPGAYTVILDTPGGEVQAKASVRVVPQGRRPSVVIARPSDDLALFVEGAAPLPADVVVVRQVDEALEAGIEAHITQGAMAPVLYLDTEDRRGVGVSFGATEDTWLLGHCDKSTHERANWPRRSDFGHSDIASAPGSPTEGAAKLPRVYVLAPSLDVPAGSYVRYESDGADAGASAEGRTVGAAWSSPMPIGAGVRVVVSDDGVRVSLAQVDREAFRAAAHGGELLGARALAVLKEQPGGYTPTHRAKVRFYPATPVPSDGYRPSLLAHIVLTPAAIAAGSASLLRTPSRRFAATMRFLDQPHAGQPMDVVLPDLSRDHQVFWAVSNLDLRAAHPSYTARGAWLQYTPRHAGQHRVTMLALGSDGTVARGSANFEVLGHRASTCSVGPLDGRDGAMPLLVLLLAGVLLVRTEARRRAFGDVLWVGRSPRALRDHDRAGVRRE